MRKIFKNEKICDLSVINSESEQKYGDLMSYAFHGEKNRKR